MVRGAKTVTPWRWMLPITLAWVRGRHGGRHTGRPNAPLGHAPLAHAAAAWHSSWAMAANIYSVGELVAYLQVSLEGDPMLSDLWLTGEVSNAMTSAAGHSYFTLREEGSSFRCVLFSRYPGAPHLADGAQVNVHGRVTVYAARGEIQLTADMVQPAGAGLLAAEFERLRVQLEREGLFEESRKRLLPVLPRRIGVVTSETGAVYHDIVQTLTRRYPLAEVVFCPALVQGDMAPAAIVAGIQRLNALGDVDVMIVGRGGGSLEDLAAFNSEAVARAIHASRVPVISAVGHETDVTIADMVADMRAPTPTAAAEMVAPDLRVLAAESQSLAVRAAAALRAIADTHAMALDGLVTTMGRLVPDTGALMQGVDDLMAQARLSLTTLLGGRRAELAGSGAALEALSPRAVLSRGYAAIERPDGARVIAAAGLSPGDAFRATLADGSVDAEVTGTGAAAPQAPSARQKRRAKPAPDNSDGQGVLL